MSVRVFAFMHTLFHLIGSFGSKNKSVRRRWSICNILSHFVLVWKYLFFFSTNTQMDTASPFAHYCCWYHTLKLTVCKITGHFHLSFCHRVIDPVVRRQHVHESGDTKRHAHRGRGRVPPLHVPAGVWPAHGRHVQRVSGYAEARARQRESQTDGQPRYRINRPRWLTSPPIQEEASLSLCFLLFSFSFWSRHDIRPNTH